MITYKITETDGLRLASIYHESNLQAEGIVIGNREALDVCIEWLNVYRLDHPEITEDEMNNIFVEPEVV